MIDLSGDWATIEGGDVMILDSGRRVLVGMNKHTNEGGFQKLSEALAGSSIEVVRVRHEDLHLDCCLAPLPNGEALCDSRTLPDASVSSLGKYFGRLIALDQDESDTHLAANVLWLDNRRVVSAVKTKKTTHYFARRGTR